MIWRCTVKYGLAFPPHADSIHNELVELARQVTPGVEPEGSIDVVVDVEDLGDGQGPSMGKVRQAIYATLPEDAKTFEVSIIRLDMEKAPQPEG